MGGRAFLGYNRDGGGAFLGYNRGRGGLLGPGYLGSQGLQALITLDLELYSGTL